MKQNRLRVEDGPRGLRRWLSSRGADHEPEAASLGHSESSQGPSAPVLPGLDLDFWPERRGSGSFPCSLSHGVQGQPTVSPGVSSAGLGEHRDMLAMFPPEHSSCKLDSQAALHSPGRPGPPFPAASLPVDFVGLLTLDTDWKIPLFGLGKPWGWGGLLWAERKGEVDKCPQRL